MAREPADPRIALMPAPWVGGRHEAGSTFGRWTPSTARVCSSPAPCLVIITLIVPYGVFTRYVLNSAASWPEPLAVLLMIVLSFLSAVVCYREHLHIGVGVLPGLLAQPWKSLLGWLLEICMLATNLFMVVWGIKLVEATWYQSIAEFPIVTAGMTYLPIPIGGALTVLFVIERLLTQDFFRQPEPETVSQISTE